jgi:galacturonosyltransferase
MKYIIISNSLWNIYNFRFNLIKELAKFGSVVIYCDSNKKGQIFKKKFPKNVLIKKLNFSSKSKNFFENLILIFKLYLILKKEKPDCLFSFTLKPNLYCGLLNNFFKFSFFPTISGLGTARNKGGILFFLVKFLMKYAFLNNSNIFVHNKNEKFFLKNLGINKNKITQVNGSGINLNKFKPLNFSKKITNNYLFIGRLIADKGIYELISAFKIFNDYKKNSRLTLAIMIDEDNETSINLKELEKIIFGSNIILKVNVRNIKKLLNNHGCLMLPSYSEGMSRSVMEAISSARPVICSNIHGCKEMVRDNYNGFLVKPKSIISIFKALKKFDSLTISQKIRFSKNSRNLVKKNRFDEKYVVSHYLNQIMNKNNESA